MSGEVLLGVVEEGIVLQQSNLHMVALYLVDMLVRRDTSASVYGPALVRELHLAVGIVLWVGVGTNVIVVVEREVVVGTLNQPS